MKMRTFLKLVFLFLIVNGCGGTALDDSFEIGDSNSNTSPTTPTLETTNTPTVSSTTPASPALSQTPAINGSSEANAAIVIYSDSACSTQVGAGTADGNGNFSITISSAMDGGDTQSFYATAQLSGENASACSSSNVSYKSTAIRPGLAFLTGTQTTAPSTPTKVNQATAYAIQWSSSEVDSNYFSHDTGTNPNELTVLQAGNYFMSATLPMQMTSGTYRATTRMEVRVNGVLYPGALGESSYIRFDATTGNFESSSHVAIFLEGLSINDVVEVFVQETAGQDGTETVSVTSVASLYMEYAGATRSIFTGTATRTVGNTNINTTSSAFEWTESLTTTDITHDNVTNPENLTLTAGNYLVQVNVPVTGSVARASVSVKVRLNGATVNGGQAGQGYMRADSGHNDASVHWSGYIVAGAGDVLTITSEQEGQTGTVNVSGVATVNVEKLPSTTGVIALRGNDLTTGTDWNTGVAGFIQWDQMDIHDTGIYTHNVASNQHQITVNEQGDYLLHYNDSLTGSNDRVSPIIKVQVNGTDVDGAETKTHYIRNVDGHNESSASLVFLLRNLSASDVITISTEQDVGAGTVNDVEDALLVIVKK